MNLPVPLRKRPSLRSFSFVLCALLGVSLAGPAPSALADDDLSLAYSFSERRSNAQPLDGATLPEEGRVAVFIAPLYPDDDIKRVQFYVNGELFKIEFFAPYDLGGSRVRKKARRVDIDRFEPGRNEIEARIFGDDDVESVTATFDVGEPSGPTILDVAGGDPRFTILTAAIEAADLEDLYDGPGPLTVFGPNDDAFLALLEELGLTAEELLGNEDLLETVLLYHTVEGKLLAEDVLAVDSLTTLQGEDVQVDATELKINDSNLVLTGLDIMASNGVIHEIDAVLLPPSLTTTIAELAAGVPELSILLEAAAEVGLDALLSVNGPQLTVFAPTNEAFVNLLTALGLTKEELFAERGLLLTVLLYHVVNEELFAEDVLAADEIFPNESEPIAVDAKEGKLNQSKIILTDQDASNGVVHLIDAVLIPPAALQLLP